MYVYSCNALSALFFGVDRALNSYFMIFYKIGDKLALIINRKSYMRFRLVRKSATLNDVKAVALRYFTEFGKPAF